MCDVLRLWEHTLKPYWADEARYYRRKHSRGLCAGARVCRRCRTVPDRARLTAPTSSLALPHASRGIAVSLWSLWLSPFHFFMCWHSKPCVFGRKGTKFPWNSSYHFVSIIYHFVTYRNLYRNLCFSTENWACFYRNCYFILEFIPLFGKPRAITGPKKPIWTRKE